MSNFKIGDLIVPNDKFYRTPSSIIADDMGLDCELVDALKAMFIVKRKPWIVRNIIKRDANSNEWLRINAGKYLNICTNGSCYCTELLSYRADYFELYKEKDLSKLILDNELIDKLI